MRPRIVAASALAAGLLAFAGLVAAVMAVGGDGDGGEQPGVRVQQGLDAAALASSSPALAQTGGGGDSAARSLNILPSSRVVEFGSPYAPVPFPPQQVGQTGITVQGFGSASAKADSAILELYFGSGAVGYGKFAPQPYPAPGQTEPGSPPVTPTETPSGERGSPPVTPTEIPSFIPSFSPEPAPPEPTPATPPPVTPITEADLQPVIDAIVAQGVPRSDIEVVASPKYDPYFSNAILRVKVAPVDALDGIVKAASDAAAGLTNIYLQSTSVSYTVSDCAGLEKSAMQAAVGDAKARGTAFAQTLGVGLGAIVGASNYSYSPFGGTPCGGGGPIGPYPLGGVSFAAGQPSDVQVAATVSITYAIQ